MNKLKLYLEWCVTTLFGILMQRKFCKVWDSKLNQLIDNHKGVLSRGGYVITFNETEVWVGNRFYAYGHLYKRFHNCKEFRPKLSTMIKLAEVHDTLKKEREDSELKDYIETINNIE